MLPSLSRDHHLIQSLTLDLTQRECHSDPVTFQTPPLATVPVLMASI